MSLLALPLDVLRLLFSEYLRDEDAMVARCACQALRALVPRARIDACRHRLYVHFCIRGYTAALVWLHAQAPLRESRTGVLCALAAGNAHTATLQWSRLLAGERLCVSTARHGTHPRATVRPKAGTRPRSSCCTSMARRVTSKRARWPPETDI